MSDRLEPPSLNSMLDPLVGIGGAVGPIRTPEQYDAERVRLLLWRRVPPTDALEPDKLKTQLDQFDRGYFNVAPKVWHQLKTRDHVVSAVALKREKDIARLPWTVLIKQEVDESQKVQAEAHKQALLDFYRGIEVTDILQQNIKGGFRELVKQMMDAVGMQYSCLEISWRPPTGSKPFSASFRKWPLFSFEARYGHTRWLPVPEILSGLPMPPDQWLVAVGDGIMRATSVLCAFRKYTMSDWLAFGEKFGLPFVLGKSPAPKGSTEWNNMVDAVTNFVGDGGAVVNVDAMMELVSAGSAAGTLPFPPLIEYLDRWITSLWRGADLSTMSAGGGEGQGASLQNEESDILEQDDADWVSGILNQQIDRQVIEYLFGEGVEPLAYVSIKPTQKADIAKEILVDQFLVGAGAPLGVDDALERYGRSRPAPGADVLMAAGSGAVVGGGGAAANKTNGPDGTDGTNDGPDDASAEGGVTAEELPKASLVNHVAELLNSRDLAQANVSLREQLTDSLAEQLGKSLAPLRKRLEAIAKVEDLAEQGRLLDQVRTTLGDHVLKATNKKQIARLFEDSLSAAFFNGIVTATK